MAASLGFRFLDKHGDEVAPLAIHLSEIEQIIEPKSLPNLRITAACDVDNPLVGRDGATYTFGPQKGADTELLALLECGMDADGQHSVRDAVRVCEEAEQYTDSLILGSRALRENVPLRSRFGNGVTRFVYRLATGLNVHDTQTGLRAFHADMIPVLLKISGDRYEYEMNELLLFARKKRPIREVEIATIYLNNNQSSHFNTTKDSCRIYKEIFKFSASSFFCFLLDYGLFSLLTVVTAGMGTIGIPVSNLASRIVSASANYTLNRRLVFKSKNDGLRSALSYFALAAVILAGNTLILTTLVSHLGMNRYLAKILTEVLFFTLSWLVQRSVIFKRKRT